MFHDTEAFSGCSINDTAAAEAFYRDTLGLEVNNSGMGLEISLAGGAQLFLYQKGDHQPASYTMLNFRVDDIDAAVDSLSKAGVTMLRYDDMSHQDDKGIARGRSVNRGPDIAWFNDPAGNILAVLQN